MGHTNQTANYDLPQFVGTDKPSWLGDINDAFAAIDTAIAAAASEATTADGKADALTTTVSGHTTQIGTLQNTVTTQGNTLNTVTSLIGNGTPTTTDQTIIGAINELNAKEGNLSDLTTTDKSSLVAAINEAAQSGGGGSESIHVTADGTKTLSALVDELYALIDRTKLKGSSYIERDGVGRVMSLQSIDTSELYFTNVTFSSSTLYLDQYNLKASSSVVSRLTCASGSFSPTDYSSQVPTSGVNITLHY